MLIPSVVLAWNVDRPLPADHRGAWARAIRDERRRLSYWNGWASAWGLHVLSRAAEARGAMFVHARLAPA